MAAASSLNECCRLAQNYHEENYECLKEKLLHCIWSYFSVSRHQETPTLAEDNDIILALLISASFAGCTSAFDFILYSYAAKTNADLSVERLINSRLPIDLPVPDTWIHKTVCLAVTPLHMACWRLNLDMIQKLLALGAHPHSLAWERVEDNNGGRNGGVTFHQGSSYLAETSSDINPSSANGGNDKQVKIQTLNFNTALGFSPLHFIVLGLRSPPRYSLRLAIDNHIIHFTTLKEEEIFSHPTNLNPVSDLYPSIYEYNPEPSQMTQEPSRTSSCEILESCIKILLCAGADPNDGRTGFLNFYFPLDLIIQPPIKIYYASSMARSTQTSECLRRQNFEANLHLITHACRTLFHGGARLSDGFLSNHRWNIQLLDCFYTHQSHSAFNLLELLIFIGIFPDNGNIDLYNECSNGNPRTCTKKDLMKFIVDVINLPLSTCLVDLVLKWCSTDVLHHIIETGKTILAQSQYSLPLLEELIKRAIKEQLHPLKHLCKLVILRAVSLNEKNIKLLPLPPCLLRDLRVIRYI